MIEVPKVDVHFDVLPVDAVRSLHARFMKNLDEKAAKALPPDAPDYDVRKLLLKELLLAAARKAIELRPETLERLAREGHEALVKQLRKGGLRRAPFLAAVGRVLRLRASLH